MYTMMNRKSGNIIYETLDANSMRISGTCQIISVTDEYMSRIQKRAIKTRKKMTSEFLKQVPNLSNLERHGFKELKPYEENPRDGVNSVIKDIEYAETRIEPKEHVQVSNLLSSKEKIKADKVEKIFKEEPKKPEVEEVKKVEIKDEPVVEKAIEKISTDVKPKKEEKHEEPKVSRLPKLSYKPLSDTPKQYRKEEMEIVVDKQDDKVVVKTKGEEIVEDIDEVIDDINVVDEEDLEKLLDSPIEEDIPEIEDEEVTEIMDDIDLDEPVLEDDIVSDGFEEVLSEGNEDVDIDDLLDEHLDGDFSDSEYDLPDMDTIDIEDLDPLEITGDNEDIDEGLFGSIDKQLSSVSERDLYNNHNNDLMDMSLDLNDDDDLDEEFDLGTYKPTNNVDRIGLISRFRPKKKTVIFPEVTRNINEVYLNKKFRR